MNIIYVPFDVDVFFAVLVLLSVLSILGYIIELGRVAQGFNPYGGFK